MLLLSCVVNGPIYGYFMGCTVNGFKPYIVARERKPSTVHNP